jgi:hypothetical protein
MTQACKDYLESSSASPERYWFLLIELQRQLSEVVVKLSGNVRSLEVLEPGVGAYKPR